MPGEHRADKHAENRVLKHQEQVLKRRDIRQAGDRSGPLYPSRTSEPRSPSRIVPVSFFLSDLENIRNTVPTSARTGVKEVGFSSIINGLSLEMPPRLKTQAVTVVPMFAPHDHADGLPEGHDPRIDKAYHHHSRRRGALDHSRTPDP